MEQPNTPENSPAGFTQLYHVFSEFLIQHGDLNDSWSRVRDGDSSLGLPRGIDTNFELRLSKNELRQNPYNFYGIHAQFVPWYTDEDLEFNADTLFAEVKLSEDLSVDFFLTFDDGVIHAMVDTVDRSTGLRRMRRDDELYNDDVELLRRVFETAQANLA
jgi:hypothetical protein